MSNSDQKTPKLRFQEFSGEWEERPLSYYLSEPKERNRASEFGRNQVLSVSGELGCLNQVKHLGRSYAGVSVQDYHVVRAGDVVYTKSPLKKAPYGIIKTNFGDNGIVSTLYAVYRPTSESCGAFINFFFDLDDHLNRYLRPIVRKGAKNDMKVNNTDVLKDLVIFPSKDEQQKISNFLCVVDEKVRQLVRKKALLEDYKKGCMQQFFTKKIRFKDDQGNDFPDWEEKKLGELADRVRHKNPNGAVTDVLTNSAVQGIISQGDYFDHDVANAENLDRYTIVQTGDFVYNPRISVSAPVGPIKRNNLRQGVMSPLYDVFRFHEKSSEFWVQYFASTTWHRYMKQVANYGARYDRMAISSQDFMDMPLPYPHPDEQQKIANFLSAIDNKISLVADELTAAQTFKKGLLQQMFV